MNVMDFELVYFEDAVPNIDHYATERGGGRERVRRKKVERKKENEYI